MFFDNYSDELQRTLGAIDRSDIEKLEANGTDAVLIGETLMRAADKKAMLDTLRGV